MATVYLARDRKHSREVAIKVMRADIAASLGAQRFLLEIQLAARLAHPHILPLFDSGEADGILYYVMPRVDGPSLRDRLKTARQLPIDEAVRLVAEVAGALDYAHRQGVVHRDIKPENILLQDSHALVADFGIGILFGAAGEDMATQTGVTLGTPTYMSPEQAVGETVDGRSDLYSLGCVLYETLIGEPPFTGPNVQAIIAKRFVQTPADVTALRDGIPRPVAAALQRALARTPIDRFHSAAEFAAALMAPPAQPGGSQAVPDRSIAVLPFVSVSADPETEYFADGITEEILNALAQVADLKVAGSHVIVFIQGTAPGSAPHRRATQCAYHPRWFRAAIRETCSHHRAVARCRGRLPALVAALRPRNRRRVRAAGRDCDHDCRKAQDLARCR